MLDGVSAVDGPRACIKVSPSWLSAPKMSDRVVETEFGSKCRLWSVSSVLDCVLVCAGFSTQAPQQAPPVAFSRIAANGVMREWMAKGMLAKIKRSQVSGNSDERD